MDYHAVVQKKKLMLALLRGFCKRTPWQSRVVLFGVLLLVSGRGRNRWYSSFNKESRNAGFSVLVKVLRTSDYIRDLLVYYFWKVAALSWVARSIDTLSIIHTLA